MDKKKLLMMGTALVALSPLAAQQAAAATGTINVDAVVLYAIEVNEVSPLDFGTFSITAAPGTVDITDGGVLGGGGYNQAGIASPNQAKVKIKASEGYAMTVSAADAIGTKITTGGGGAGKSMTITAVDLAGGTAGGIDTNVVIGTAPGTGEVTLGIGGTLTFGVGQVPGVYSGTFDVVVSYN